MKQEPLADAVITVLIIILFPIFVIYLSCQLIKKCFTKNVPRETLKRETYKN